MQGFYMNDAVNCSSSLCLHQFLTGAIFFILVLSGTRGLAGNNNDSDAMNSTEDLELIQNAIIEKHFESLVQSRSALSAQLILLRAELHEKVFTLGKVKDSLEKKEDRYRQAQMESVKLERKLENLEETASTYDILCLSLEHVLKRYQDKMEVLKMYLPQVKTLFDGMKLEQKEFSQELRDLMNASISLDKAIELKTEELIGLAKIRNEKRGSPNQLIPAKLLHDTKASEITSLESDLWHIVDEISQLMSFNNKADKEIFILQQRLSDGEKQYSEIKKESETLTHQLQSLKQSDSNLIQSFAKINEKLHASKEQKAYYKQSTAYLEQKLAKQGKEIANLVLNYTAIGSRQAALNEKIRKLKMKLESKLEDEQLIEEINDNDCWLDKCIKSQYRKYDHKVNIENF